VSLGSDLGRIVAQADLKSGVMHALRVTQFDGRPVAK
jgi:hypothetical protein